MEEDGGTKHGFQGKMEITMSYRSSNHNLCYFCLQSGLSIKAAISLNLVGGLH